MKARPYLPCCVIALGAAALANPSFAAATIGNETAAGDPASYEKQIRMAQSASASSALERGATVFQVFFALDSAELDAAAREEISRAAGDWQRGGSGQISVIGHSDTSGSADYNMRLSEQRAEAVEAALVREGLPSDQIRIVARGQDDLLVPTSDDVREDENRRVEIVLPAAPPVEERADTIPAPEPVPPAPARTASPTEPEANPFTFALGPVYGYNYGENDNGADNNLFGVELTFRALPDFLGGVSLSQMGLWSYNGIDDGLTGRTVASLDFAPDFGIFRPTLAVNGGLVYGEAVQDGFVVGPELRFDVIPIAGFNVGLKVAYDYQFEAEDWDKGILWGGLDLGIRF